MAKPTEPETANSRAESGAEIIGWFAGRLPDGWFAQAPDVSFDRDEILVVGTIGPPETPAEASAAASARARLTRFREETRDARVAIAAEAELETGRKVSWGARCGEEQMLFTHLAIPVMTRLRLPERRVLDTLVAGGVARSRSEALSWCVQLVGRHEADWISQLRDALVAVDEARAAGPSGA